MENKNIYLLITAFLLLIVGISLIGVIATEVKTRTSLTSVAEESQAIQNVSNVVVNETAVYTVTNYPTGWKTTDCPISNFIMKNQSGTVIASTNYTLTASAGTFTLKNATATKALTGIYNKTYYSYDYCGDEYINSSWQRSVLNLVLGFFALALLGIALAMFYAVMKNEGLLNI